MSLIVVVSGADTYVHEGRPTKPGGDTPRPIAGSGSDKRKHTLVRSGELARAVRGRTVSSAKFSWEAGNAHPAHTLQLHALAEGFSPENETWDKRPDVIAANAVTVDVPATQAGQRRSVEMGALVQQLANGATHHGFRLFSTVDANLAYVGFDDRDPETTSWQWDIEVEDDSDAPVDVAPDGGGVGPAKPKVKWRLDDADPKDAEVDVQTAYQVQADVPAAGANPSATAPAYDSGVILSGEPMHDLANPPANTSGATPVFTAPPIGGNAFWRTRVKMGNAGWSKWTAWASWTRRPKGTLQILSPAPGSAPTPVTDSTLTVQARVVDGAGNPVGTANVEAYRVIVVRAATGLSGATSATGANQPETRRYDSGWIYTDDLTFTHEIPARYEGRPVLVDDSDYEVIVLVLDRHDRVPTPGDRDVLEASVLVSYDADSAVAKPSSVEVTQVGGRGALPVTRIVVKRSTAPDAWEFRRNPDEQGVELVARIDADPNAEAPDGLGSMKALSPGRWAWEYDEVPALEQNVWSVTAVDTVNGKRTRSRPTKAEPFQLVTYGIWLIHPTIGSVKLYGSVGDFWHADDVRSTFVPLDGSPDIDVLYGQRGLASDQFVGYVVKSPAMPPIAQQIRRLHQMHKRPMDKLRLVFGAENRRVMLRHFTPPVADDDTNPENRRHRVRFSFWEV